jgi:hypothetical protein
VNVTLVQSVDNKNESDRIMSLLKILATLYDYERSNRYE